MLENIHTLMLREKISGRRLAEALDLGRGALATKLAGKGSFYYLEVRALCHFFKVSYEELEGTLPSYDEWVTRFARSEGFEPPTFCSVARPTLRLIQGGAETPLLHLASTSLKVVA